MHAHAKCKDKCPRCKKKRRKHGETRGLLLLYIQMYLADVKRPGKGLSGSTVVDVITPGKG